VGANTGRGGKVTVTNMYRYEIHLPIKYNDGSQVEQEKFLTTRIELQSRFGGLTANGPVTGWWVDGDQAYEDEQYIFIVDTLDHDAAFWQQYAELLRQRFEQEVLYIVSHPIEQVHTA